MPTNNFKLFDQNKANLLSDTEYANATQRLNGVQTGVASSQLNNKFAYQVSLVAYAIAQLMNANGLDASDTLAVSAFVGNLQGAILQKVADKATSAEAAAGVLSNKYITPETMKAAALLLSGGVMSGVLDMGNNRITNLGTPTADSDAVTKGYVDGKFLKADILNEQTIASFNTSATESVRFGIGLKNFFDLIKNYDLAYLEIDGSNTTSGNYYTYGFYLSTSHTGTLNPKDRNAIKLHMANNVKLIYKFYIGDDSGKSQVWSLNKISHNDLYNTIADKSSGNLYLVRESVYDNFSNLHFVLKGVKL